MAMENTCGFLDKLHPGLRQWFSDRFEGPTEVQCQAVPRILEGRHVIVSSPTGSGKTLSAFTGILSRLLDLADRGELEDRTYCIYISPLKALTSDIEVNLKKPLDEMMEAGVEAAKAIRLGIRTGDTSEKERRAMANLPPHIYLTTPESFALSISSPVFGRSFDTVEYLVVDEIHDLVTSTRGAFMALFMSLLESRAPGLQRIGISATMGRVAPVSRFLMSGADGSPAVCRGSGAGADIRIVRPEEDLLTTPLDRVLKNAARTCWRIAQKEGTTLVFTTTRSDAESLAHAIGNLRGKPVPVHHGSLSERERRLVEEGLRNGEHDLAVTSSSLELGIDIGGIEAAVIYGSPASIARTLQRVGRSGHKVGVMSKGYLIPRDPGDLLEMAAILEGVKEGVVEDPALARCSADMVCQFIVAASTREFTPLDTIHDLAAKTPGCDIGLEDVFRLAETLADSPSGRLVELKGGSVKATGRGRMVLFQNVGSITSIPSIKVVDASGVSLGTLSPGFASGLERGDVIVLGGESYSVREVDDLKVLVERTGARFPTVPNWSGEGIPRSELLNGLVYRLLSEGHGDRDVSEWLREYDARGVSRPRRGLLHVQHIDGGGGWTIVSGCLGRAIWMGFGRLLRHAGLVGSNPVAMEDGLLIQGECDLKGLGKVPEVVDHGADPVVRILRTSIGTRALVTPENVGEERIAYSARSRSAWAFFENLDPDHPLKEEERKALETEKMDLEGAVQLWESVRSGETVVERVEEPLLPLSRIVISRGALDLLTLPRLLSLDFSRALGIGKMFGEDESLVRYVKSAWGRREDVRAVSLRPVGGHEEIDGIYLSKELVSGNPRADRRNAVIWGAYLGLPLEPFEKEGFSDTMDLMKKLGAVAVGRVDGVERLILMSDLARARGNHASLWETVLKRNRWCVRPCKDFGVMMERFPLVKDLSAAWARGLAEEPPPGMFQGRFNAGRLVWMDERDRGAVLDLLGDADIDFDLGILPDEGAIDLAWVKEHYSVDSKRGAEILSLLEKAMYVRRDRSRDGKMVIYRVDTPPERVDWRILVTRFVGGMGAASPVEVADFFGIDVRRANDVLDELVESGDIVVVRAGFSGIPFYSDRSFADTLERPPTLTGELTFLGVKDPLVSNLGTTDEEGFVLEDGMPSGSVFVEWPPYAGQGNVLRASANLKLLDEDKSLLDGLSVLKGRRIRAATVPARATGIGIPGGNLSYVGAKTRFVELEELFSLMLSRQHLAENTRMPDAYSTVISMGGMRSDMCLGARTKRYQPLATLRDKDDLVKTKLIQGVVYTAPVDVLPLHQAVRRMPLDSGEARVLEIVRDGQFLPLERISQLSGLSKGKTLITLRRLQEGLYVYKDRRGRYIPVPDIGVGTDDAVDSFVKDVLGGTGPMRVEDIYVFLKRSLGMEQLSKSLERLRDVGGVECAFMLEGTPYLYWWVPGETKPAKGWAVVSPQDRTHDFFTEHLTVDADKAYLVFHDGTLRGYFTARTSGKRLIPERIEGGKEVVKAGREFAHRVGMAWGQEVNRTEDWEVLDWWERTRGSGT